MWRQAGHNRERHQCIADGALRIGGLVDEAVIARVVRSRGITERSVSIDNHTAIGSGGHQAGGERLAVRVGIVGQYALGGRDLIGLVGQHRIGIRHGIGGEGGDRQHNAGRGADRSGAIGGLVAEAVRADIAGVGCVDEGPVRIERHCAVIGCKRQACCHHQAVRIYVVAQHTQRRRNAERLVFCAGVAVHLG